MLFRRLWLFLHYVINKYYKCWKYLCQLFLANISQQISELRWLKDINLCFNTDSFFFQQTRDFLRLWHEGKIRIIGYLKMKKKSLNILNHHYIIDYKYEYFCHMHLKKIIGLIHYSIILKHFQINSDLFQRLIICHFITFLNFIE